MKRILIPTDFSKNADHALKYAIKLSELLRSELFLFHSCRADAVAFQLQISEGDEETIIQKAKLDLNNYCAEHSSETINIKVNPVVEYGLAVDTIVDAIEKYKIDLVIMGTKGDRAVEDVLIGSNTMSVIEKVSCPILAIPEKTKIENISKIVFATDYRENDIESINYLSEIAELLKAKIIVVHVADFFVPASYEKALLEVFQEDLRKKVTFKNISFEVLQGMNSTKVLNQYLKDNYIDLLAVSTRKKNIFEKLFDKSFTKKMTYHSNIPLLAFHVNHSF